jgi:hypothetical protein
LYHVRIGETTFLLPVLRHGSIIRLMRRLLFGVLLASGCAAEPAREPSPYTPGAGGGVSASSEVSGPSAARDIRDLDPYDGQSVSLAGTFDHDRAIHGIVVLRSGLRVFIPHFDNLRLGDDWLKYVGNSCSASGILHTYTKDIDGYRGPSLELTGFSGSLRE